MSFCLSLSVSIAPGRLFSRAYRVIYYLTVWSSESFGNSKKSAKCENKIRGIPASGYDHQGKADTSQRLPIIVRAIDSPIHEPGR